MTGVMSYEAAEAGLADVLRQGSVRAALVTTVLPGEGVGGGRGMPVLGGWSFWARRSPGDGQAGAAQMGSIARTERDGPEAWVFPRLSSYRASEAVDGVMVLALDEDLGASA